MIRHKSILIKNVYYMLSYAFTVLGQGDYEEVATEDFENIHNLFAAILSKGINRQLKQGLYREYLNRKEDVVVARGKINMSGTIRNKLARKRLLNCEYDELSENKLMNQVLKTAAVLLLRHAKVNVEYKNELKKEMLFFSNVDTIDPLMIRWANIRFQQNNSTYRMLIGLCRLIFDGMLLTTDSGEYRLATFLNKQSMSRLYEKFILEYYKNEHKELHASSSQIPWNLDDDKNDMLPIMQSDIMLNGNDKTLIIDAKYYKTSTQSRYDSSTIRSAHLYQIYSYVKNYDKGRTGDVSGMLLYAKTDEDTPPSGSYSMDGNKIMVRTLDLNCDFAKIRKQLDDIAVMVASPSLT